MVHAVVPSLTTPTILSASLNTPPDFPGMPLIRRGWARRPGLGCHRDLALGQRSFYPICGFGLKKAPVRQSLRCASEVGVSPGTEVGQGDYILRDVRRNEWDVLAVARVPTHALVLEDVCIASLTVDRVH